MTYEEKEEKFKEAAKIYAQGVELIEKAFKTTPIGECRLLCWMLYDVMSLSADENKYIDCDQLINFARKTVIFQLENNGYIVKQDPIKYQAEIPDEIKQAALIVSNYLNKD